MFFYPETSAIGNRAPGFCPKDFSRFARVGRFSFLLFSAVV
jgi:hypothetical protein